MASLDGITDLHMSGARAVFGLESGAKVSKETLAAAFEAQGMQLVTFERIERPRPAALYQVDTGVT